MDRLISQPFILFFKLDFVDSNAAHNIDSGIVGNMSLKSFGQFAVSAVQALASPEKSVLENNMKGVCSGRLKPNSSIIDLLLARDAF